MQITARRVVRCGVGLIMGTATAAVELLFALLAGVVMLTAAVGLGYGTFGLYGWFLLDGIRNPGSFVLGSLGGLFLVFLAVQGIFGVAGLEGQLARHFLGSRHQEELERRIAELAASRAAVVDAVHDERRRIERDLHDGVQQRLVALGLLLGRARRSLEAAVEKHTNAIFDKLELTGGEGYSRRVLAVLRYLGS